MNVIASTAAIASATAIPVNSEVVTPDSRRRLLGFGLAAFAAR